MQQFFSVVRVRSMIRRQCSLAGVYRALTSLIAWFAAACAVQFCLTVGLSASGQLPSPVGPVQSTADSQADQGSSASTSSSDLNGSPGRNSNSLTGSGIAGTRTALSADQIDNILQQSPDLVEELKSQLADHMQQQGVQVDANDISDQMLYNQIASSSEVRANITTVLRARGYVSDEDLQSAGGAVAEQEGNSPLSSAQSLSMAGGATANGVDAGSRASGELTGTEGATGSVMSADAERLNRHQLGQRQYPRNQEKTNASTDVPRVLHQPTPYDLQSLRDLYTQIPNETASLRRFGSDVFVNRGLSAAARGVSARDTPLDVPLGPDYVLGPGDTLTIRLWGGVTQSIIRSIDRGGTIFLPEAGSIGIAGLSLGKAQTVVEGALKQQYRNAQVAVTVSRLRSVRIYVIGDVQRPGGYDISSLSTPVSALYAAGGPTATGSLRTLRHYRGKQLVEEVDLYDFLLRGIRNGSASFESGDTLLVPPVGPMVAVSGAVRRPAIYELKAGESALAALIDNAGGFTAAASLSHIRIERIDANHQRQTLTLPDTTDQSSLTDHGANAMFEVKDGDRVRVDPILPYSQSAIYLAGHVARPGRRAYTDGMRLSDVLHSYQDMLPEPAAHGEIVRLVPPDLHAETLDFDVPDVLIGNANVDLRPFDTVRVFGRYQVDAPRVTITGEVLRPGDYPMSQGMTAAQLVRMAGGFKRDAFVESADLTSYEVKSGNSVVENLQTVQLGAAVTGGNPNADVPLKPGDILAVHKITNWESIGESITIEGQIRYPGSYGFQDGERLSSVVRRAGGLLSNAYPMGAVLIREQVKELEQKSRDELIRQIETSAAAAKLSPSLGSANASGAVQLIKDQQDQVITDLKTHPPTGRMVIQINTDIDGWANTPADIELRRGDSLLIPKRPGFVLVSGQVYNATALTFTPGKTAAWYLGRAGGTNGTANRKEVFIIRANGSVVGRHSGGRFDANVLSTRLNPGDVVVVPQKIIGGSTFWRNLMATGQLAASIVITSAVAAASL